MINDADLSTIKFVQPLAAVIVKLEPTLNAIAGSLTWR